MRQADDRAITSLFFSCVHLLIADAFGGRPSGAESVGYSEPAERITVVGKSP